MSQPFMQFYVGDYLRDTGHLSTLEHGAYLLMILHYWSKGSLPNDDAALARICRMSSREWARSRDTLAGLFGDGWTHKRIDAELEKARAKSQKRAVSGSAGGKEKANRQLQNCDPKNEFRKTEKIDNPLIINDSSLANANILLDVCSSIYQNQNQNQKEEEVSSSSKTSLETQCRAMVGSEPVLLALDFWQLEKIVSDGLVTDADILAGVRAAMATPNFRIKSWSQLVNWAKRAAKDRMGAAPKSQPATTPQPRAVVSDETWRTRMASWVSSGRRSVGWMPNWGPLPGRGGCEVPDHIIAEFPQSERAA